ncbi:MAG: tRNA (guanine-N1)-methyltransferase [Comamonadaceae bacterium BICA1-1]|nr:MAG: tRNA (guanine-N1)-methyltransferase [Comamonadaceae bacterium BICA1-1]
MRFDLITLFPELFEPFMQHGIARRAYESGVLQVRLWPLRDFAEGPYRRVDDRPFGGGPGMVMLAEPLRRCWEAIRHERQQLGLPDVPTILFSPQGRRLDHTLVAEQAQASGAILVCGRYEGIDQRFIDQCVDSQISLGDFVLSGGELAALALLDAVARLLPGVLNDALSHQQDSFNPAIAGLLDCPHYTRPERWCGPQGEAEVPEVLLSGHHARIEAWRTQQRRDATARLRPDLLQAYCAEAGEPKHAKNKL